MKKRLKEDLIYYLKDKKINNSDTLYRLANDYYESNNIKVKGVYIGDDYINLIIYVDEEHHTFKLSLSELF